MNSKEEHWGAGLWVDEPDELAWREFITGYQCYIRRSSYGTFCGYVRVPYTNKLYRKSYTSVTYPGLDVHGGITFSGTLQSYGKKGWWVGYDTAHWDDYSPGMAAWAKQYSLDLYKNSDSRKYRNLSFCWEECTNLAMQISQYDRRKK